VVPDIPREIDRRHAAVAEPALERKAVAQAGGQRGGRIGQAAGVETAGISPGTCGAASLSQGNKREGT
jgi:hypothetical protein